MDLAETSPRSLMRSSRMASFDPVSSDAVVCLRGEHDLSTRDELTAVLHWATELFEDDVLLDMEELEFMDASTIGAIVACRNALEAQGRTLIVRSPTPAARRLLDICGMNSLLDDRGLR